MNHTTGTTQTNRAPQWSLWIALCVWIAIIIWSVDRLHPPQLTRSEDDTTFSAVRAIETLDRVLQDLEQHSVGTSGADEIRARLKHELELLGAEVDIHPG